MSSDQVTVKRRLVDFQRAKAWVTGIVRFIVKHPLATLLSIGAGYWAAKGGFVGLGAALVQTGYILNKIDEDINGPFKISFGDYEIMTQLGKNSARIGFTGGALMVIAIAGSMITANNANHAAREAAFQKIVTAVTSSGDQNLKMPYEVEGTSEYAPFCYLTWNPVASERREKMILEDRQGNFFSVSYIDRHGEKVTEPYEIPPYPEKYKNATKIYLPAPGQK